MSRPPPRSWRRHPKSERARCSDLAELVNRDEPDVRGAHVPPPLLTQYVPRSPLDEPRGFMSLVIKGVSSGEDHV